jgi:addiction module HigA family antidote
MPKTKAETPMMAPVHPGAMLQEDFLDPLGVSQYRLAQAIGVPARRINEIVHGTRRISADTALRLSRFFGMSDGFWMNLQAHYDLEVEKDRLRTTLAGIEPLEAAS